MDIYFVIFFLLYILKNLVSYSVPGDQVNLNHVADMMQKQRTTPINDFEISHDNDTGIWHVDGAGLQRFVQMTNWRYDHHYNSMI